MPHPDQWISRAARVQRGELEPRWLAGTPFAELLNRILPSGPSRFVPFADMSLPPIIQGMGGAPGAYARATPNVLGALIRALTTESPRAQREAEAQQAEAAAWAPQQDWSNVPIGRDHERPRDPYTGTSTQAQGLPTAGETLFGTEYEAPIGVGQPGAVGVPSPAEMTQAPSFSGLRAGDRAAADVSAAELDQLDAAIKERLKRQGVLTAAFESLMSEAETESDAKIMKAKIISANQHRAELQKLEGELFELNRDRKFIDERLRTIWTTEIERQESERGFQQDVLFKQLADMLARSTEQRKLTETQRVEARKQEEAQAGRTRAAAVIPGLFPGLDIPSEILAGGVDPDLIPQLIQLAMLRSKEQAEPEQRQVLQPIVRFAG